MKRQSVHPTAKKGAGARQTHDYCSQSEQIATNFRTGDTPITWQDTPGGRGAAAAELSAYRPPPAGAFWHSTSMRECTVPCATKA